jgi:hypothetical protein
MKTANDYLIDVHGNGISNFDSVPNVRRTHTVSTLSVRFVPDNGNGDAHSVLVLRRCHHRRKGKQTPIKKMRNAYEYLSGRDRIEARLERPKHG